MSVMLMLALIGISTIATASVEVNATVDTSSVYIGDIITYRITVTYDPGDSIANMPHGVNLYSFQIRNYHPIPKTKMPDGRWRIGDEYRITAYRPGTYVIPPIPVEYRTASGKSGELVTQPLTIKIKSLGVTEADTLKPIKSPVTIPAKVEPWAWMTLAGIALIVLIIGGIILWRRHRRHPEKTEDIIEVVDEIAEFDKIPIEQLIADGEIKVLYILVSEGMRRYVSRRYRIDAMELTHEELVEELRTAHVTQEESSLILEFLDRCDLVKFAKFIPSEEELTSLVVRAKDVVQRTQIQSSAAEVPDTPKEVAESEPVTEQAAVVSEPQSGEDKT